MDPFQASPNSPNVGKQEGVDCARCVGLLSARSGAVKTTTTCKCFSCCVSVFHALVLGTIARIARLNIFDFFSTGFTFSVLVVPHNVY